MSPPSRRFLACCLASILLAQAGCSQDEPRRRLASWSDRTNLPFFGAIALGLFTHPPDPGMADEDFAAISALGATGIVYPVLWSSDNIHSTRIEPFDYGVSVEAYDRSTIEIVRRAHARGLAVELRPIIRLEHLSPGQWRGTLQPSSWSAWWEAYRTFILHHAAVARTAGAEIFCIGSELRTTETDRKRWAGLIPHLARPRQVVVIIQNWRCRDLRLNR